MFQTLKRALSLLSPREKRGGILIFGLVLVLAIIETAGVASIMPFLAVLANPDVVHTNPALSAVYSFFGFQSIDRFLIALGVAAFLMIVFSSAFRLITNLVLFRFAEMRRHSLSKKLLETYLRQPYTFFLNRNSSELAKNILSEVESVVSNVYRPAMFMVAQSVVVLALVALLIALEPLVALAIALIFGGIYGVFFLLMRRILDGLGRGVVRENRERFKVASEALGGIKSIKLFGRESAYLRRYHAPSMQLARHIAKYHTLNGIPRAVIESIAFGGVILVTLMLLATKGGVASGGFAEMVPILGVYAVAGARILPGAQIIYSGLSSLRFGAAAVKLVYEDLRQRASLAQIHDQRRQRLSPKTKIVLENISFGYPESSATALQEISVTIPVRTSLGLVGATGSGKTTLGDLILGLLRPHTGVIKIDEEAITEANLRDWQQALGYVPQEIFLVDSTIAENIALGVPAEEVDYTQVARCAEMAKIHEFIMEDLPDQYDTVVGDRGVRLSGGQRQRIGIARALYREPDVLVFDEATSALDNATEHAVMDAIADLAKQQTMVLIAHRLETLKACDQILVLEKGRAVGVGTYETLMETNAQFRKLALAEKAA